MNVYRLVLGILFVVNGATTYALGLLAGHSLDHYSRSDWAVFAIGLIGNVTGLLFAYLTNPTKAAQTIDDAVLPPTSDGMLDDKHQ